MRYEITVEKTVNFYQIVEVEASSLEEAIETSYDTVSEGGWTQYETSHDVIVATEIDE